MNGARGGAGDGSGTGSGGGPSHLGRDGRARMVDVGDKPQTLRRAEAEAVLITGPEVLAALDGSRGPKGDPFETARVAGIMAAKRTAELIPLCHALALDHADVRLEVGEDRIVVRASAATRAATGVEMEALTAASVAALTLYDMLKALSKQMRIDGVRLLAKSGGRSADYRAPDAGPAVDEPPGGAGT
jgi:cyclic pyranopterin phosphate synthase